MNCNIDLSSANRDVYNLSADRTFGSRFHSILQVDISVFFFVVPMCFLVGLDTLLILSRIILILNLTFQVNAFFSFFACPVSGALNM